MNNETKGKSNYEDNTITQSSQEDVEADLTLDEESEDMAQKLDDDEKVV
ncbi:hypothetical protein [Nitrosomonas ureae]|uniref:Uncharacterized protein n=1 Tax=Nitrosomonas ureae TaxID=44577 RepID=A0A286A266_9PROT|nr:hypothetical protein [Nitrosomonas ureae]SOD16002.1 hypothetical protein SAMN06297164_0183 [Nitrosomonas ureae]